MSTPGRTDVVHLSGIDGVPAIVAPASQAVSAGGFVFLAGQVPKDPSTGLVPEAFEDQARQVLRNLANVAAAAGSSLRDAVSVRVYLGDMGRASTFNEIYREVVPEPFPVRTAIHSSIPGFDIEVDAILYPAGPEAS